MNSKTVKALNDYALTLPAGQARAKGFGIAQKIKRLKDHSIADALTSGHASADGALREAAYLVDTGCAVHSERKPGFHGTYTFEDGSTLN